MPSRPGSAADQNPDGTSTELRITTSSALNKHPDDWGAVLHDDDLAAAIVDRVLERGRLLHLDGPSMRTKHLRRDARVLDEGQPSAAAPATQPERGRSQGRDVPRRNDEDEAPRRNDEGRLDAKAERRLSRRQLGPRSATHHADLGARAAAVAGSPQVVRISGIQESEFSEPTASSWGQLRSRCSCHRV